MTAADTETAAPAADATRPDDGAEAWETPTGLVRVTAPSGTAPYYRLEWKDPETGRRKQSTGGRVFAKAWKKAVDKERGLSDGETEKHQQPTSVGIGYWLDPARPTPKTVKGWGDSHRSHMEAYARDYFTPTFGTVKLVELRRRHFQKAVDMAPTRGEGLNVRRAGTSLIAALHQGGLLPEDRVIDLASVWWHGVEADPAEVEETEDTEDTAAFVARVKRPSNDQVRALRVAAETMRARGKQCGIWWRGLMVETAAYAGPRWSELVALTAADVLPEVRKLRIHWRVSQPAGKPRRLTPPKMAKRRTSIYPAVTPTGYRLEEQLRRRAAEALVEQAEGRNPRALLFPNSRGEWMYTGNFHRDFFTRAAAAAGWECRTVTRSNGKGKTKTVQAWTLTWHSLRHTFCTFALEEWQLPVSVVSLAAGHANPATTMRLYVDAAGDALDLALAAPEPWVKQLAPAEK